MLFKIPFLDQVLIETSKEVKVTEILLEIKGRAKASWISKSNNKNLNANEPYFCEQFNTAYTHKFEPQKSTDAVSNDVKNSKATFFINVKRCLILIKYKILAFNQVLIF